ncbi:hypothetical protein SARC_02099 [Sphaeroforma arctica JP610]|uniref:Uncharacterized protein n=1 Tax=Sphaeroforma arctica JP610 TaxID=667725 RepID=A0A0L0G9P6_9EUKA|nr:hypothetical protein SARC_02099 [Sphaeroforma arctica JP610]KNC85725.1 hypothetical protein SARC_02099 [Sphaeroforma arctica JP610]|eukprot:XP_014159627.1 hypothetical protein SARC_02099 [Sphaeroforma arctica JP610]
MSRSRIRKSIQGSQSQDVIYENIPLKGHASDGMDVFDERPYSLGLTHGMLGNAHSQDCLYTPTDMRGLYDSDHALPMVGRSHKLKSSVSQGNNRMTTSSQDRFVFTALPPSMPSSFVAVGSVGMSRSDQANARKSSGSYNPRNGIFITSSEVEMIQFTAELLARERQQAVPTLLRKLAVASHRPSSAHNTQQIVEILLGADKVTGEDERMLTTAMMNLYDSTSKFEKDSAALMLYTVLMDGPRADLVFHLFYTLHVEYYRVEGSHHIYTQVYTQLLELLQWMLCVSQEAERDFSGLWYRALLCWMTFAEGHSSLPINCELLTALLSHAAYQLSASDRMRVASILISQTTSSTPGRPLNEMTGDMLGLISDLFMNSTSCTERSLLFKALALHAFDRFGSDQSDDPLVHRSVVIKFLLQSGADAAFQQIGPCFSPRFAEELGNELLNLGAGAHELSLQPKAAALVPVIVEEIYTLVRHSFELHRAFSPIVTSLTDNPYSNNEDAIEEVILLYASNVKSDHRNAQALVREVVLKSNLAFVNNEDHVINSLMDRIARLFSSKANLACTKAIRNTARGYAMALKNVSLIYVHKDRHNIRSDVTREAVLKWVAKRTKPLRAHVQNDILTQTFCVEAFVSIAYVPAAVTNSRHFERWHGIFEGEGTISAVHAKLCDTAFVNVVLGIGSHRKQAHDIKVCDRRTWAHRAALLILSIACSPGKAMFEKMGGFKVFKPLTTSNDPVIAWMASSWTLTRFKADHPKLYEDLKLKIWGRHNLPPKNPYQRMRDLLNFKQQYTPGNTPNATPTNTPMMTPRGRGATGSGGERTKLVRTHSQPATPTALLSHQYNARVGVSNLNINANIQAHTQIQPYTNGSAHTREQLLPRKGLSRLPSHLSQPSTPVLPSIEKVQSPKLQMSLGSPLLQELVIDGSE